MDLVKRPLSYNEQVEYLKEHHGLLIDSTDVAINILKKVNYYRLSAYGIGLTEPNNKEKYLPKISINTLYDLYMFDSNLRNILIHTIEQLEIQLRSQLSNYLTI